MESSFSLTSTAFENGEAIPAVYTCDGADTSPPLAWSAPPSTTQSLALIVDDPDAPDPKAPKMTWVHWVLYDIPPAIRELPEGIAPDALPKGTLGGINDWKRTGYGGPCPPVGSHRYFFKLYALDTVFGDLGTVTKADLLKKIEGHTVATAQLVGTYAHPK